jgi:hypothetical protein
MITEREGVKTRAITTEVSSDLTCVGDAVSTVQRVVMGRGLRWSVVGDLVLRLLLVSFVLSGD